MKIVPLVSVNKLQKAINNDIDGLTRKEFAKLRKISQMEFYVQFSTTRGNFVYAIELRDLFEYQLN